MLGVLQRVQEGGQGSKGTFTFLYLSAQRDIKQSIYVYPPLFFLLQLK
jgi:hypothetical protein